MDNNLIAAGWIGLALLAGLISFRTGISASLLEIVMGVAAGNLMGLFSTPFVDFLAGFGSVVLTFLAGAEVDPKVLRSKFKESFLIGFFSFLIPFLAAFAVAYYVAGWDLGAAGIAGLTISCTSVAIVYTVVVETGLNATELGKILLAACFITGMFAVVGLSVLFANFDILMLAFTAALALVLIVLPRFTRWFFRTFAGHMSELETRYIFLILLGLGGLASFANSQAVLPAYLVGIVLAGVFVTNPALVKRTRSIAFTFLTPFFFLKAGTMASLPMMAGGAGIILLLLAVKLGAKFVGLYPLTKVLGFGRREGMYTTFLMSAGLTLDVIIALYGVSHGIIDQTKYTILVSATILSAIVPTLIAQTFFRPMISVPEFTEAEMVGGAERGVPPLVAAQDRN